MRVGARINDERALSVQHPFRTLLMRQLTALSLLGGFESAANFNERQDDESRGISEMTSSKRVRTFRPSDSDVIRFLVKEG